MVKDLVFTSPEAEGLSSQKVLDFMSFMDYWKINLHSFMVIRHGKILAEAYAKPFDKDFKHRIYSCSKSYVALAVGKLIKENRVKLDDKLYKYFVDEADAEKLHPYLKDLTIDQALRMTVPQQYDTYFDGRTWKTTPWADTFFDGSTPIIKPNGVLFKYNTSSPFILDVLVERLTGMTYCEYLAPEFAEIGIKDKLFCVQSTDGYSWGGSGVLTTMRDYAKVAELMMHKGVVDGKELLPEWYMERMTTKQIDNSFDGGYGCNTFGYGYQLWMHSSGFAMHGMGSQFAFVFPEKDFIVACFADTQCAGHLYNDKIFYAADMMYRSLQDVPLKEDEKTAELKVALENFELPKGFGAAHSPIEKKINGVRYELQDNPMGWKWLEFSFEGEHGVLKYENERGVKKINFGLENYYDSNFPETHYWAERIGTPSNRELRCLSNAAFTSENRILLRVYIIDVCFGHLGIVAEFNGDDCAVQMQKVAEHFLDEYQGIAIGKKVK